MTRILITGSALKINRTSLICRLLKVYSGFTVIQIKEKGLFTSITSDAEGEESDLFKNSGAIQVIKIHTDPVDLADAMDQAMCLLPLQAEGIMIEGINPPDNFRADIVISLTDEPLSKPNPIPVKANIVIAKPESKKDINWLDPAGIPVFFLDMQDINEEEWKRFLIKLNGLLDSIKT